MSYFLLMVAACMLAAGICLFASFGLYRVYLILYEAYRQKEWFHLFFGGGLILMLSSLLPALLALIAARY